MEGEVVSLSCNNCGCTITTYYVIYLLHGVLCMNCYEKLDTKNQRFCRARCLSSEATMGDPYEKF